MKQILKITPEFILICYVLFFIFFKHPGETWDRSINSDGKGYYAYLPAIFIYHDLTYKFVESYESKYYPADHSVFKEFRLQYKGKVINKYFPGLAILLLPFFLIAHLLSYFLGFPMDGYSFLYQYAISIAALFYLWLGCRFTMRLLSRSGASLRIAAFVTFLIAFGTNIIFFAIVEDSMTHVYSFALISMFLFYSYRYFHDNKGKYFIFSAFLFGLILLIRPTNGMILLTLPLMAWIACPEYRNPLTVIFRPVTNIRYLVSGFLILFLLLLIPVILWHITTGHWFVYQYGEERLHFLQPHFYSILFSYNRGWFLYTPVALISLIGIYDLWKKNKIVYYWTFLFFLIFIYISSCWWDWYYASKCGQRIFVELYPIIAILLLFLFKLFQNKRLIRNILSSILLLFTGLNIFQSYQHALFIFPATYITRDIYWDSFPRLYPTAKVYLPQEAVIGCKSFFTDMEKPEGWENPWTIRSPFGYSGKHCSMITHTHPYSVGRYETLAPLFTSNNRVIKVSAMVWSLDKNSGSTLVVETRSGDQKLSYNSFYLAPFVHADQWTPVEAAFYVPRDIPENSIAKIYFFNNKGSPPLFIDDMKIDFLSLKDEMQYTFMEGIQSPVR